MELFLLRTGEGGEERPLHGAAVGGLKLLVEIQQRCVVRHHHADAAGFRVIGADHGRPAAGGREIVEEFFDLEGAGLAGNFLGLKTVVGKGQSVRQLPPLAPHQHLVMIQGFGLASEVIVSIQRDKEHFQLRIE